jgi:F-type H+-transporting ATPase subunit gamma
VGAIVFGSDQGLVGQFNEAMAEFVEKTLGTLPGEKKIWAVGERIYARLADASLPLAAQFAVPSSVSTITALVGQLQMASAAQGDGGCAEVHVFHSRPTSGALCEPVSQRLLPLDALWQKDLAKLHWPRRNLPHAPKLNRRGTLRCDLGFQCSCAEMISGQDTSSNLNRCCV